MMRVGLFPDLLRYKVIPGSSDFMIAYQRCRSICQVG